LSGIDRTFLVVSILVLLNKIKIMAEDEDSPNKNEAKTFEEIEKMEEYP